MRVALFRGLPGGPQWCIAGPMDLPDGETELAWITPLSGVRRGSEGWMMPELEWIYVLTDEVQSINGEIVRIMLQDRLASPSPAPSAFPRE